MNYLGNDKMGRPVVLHTVRNVRFSRITNRERFFYFHFYFYGIYLRSKMEGWVDQFDAIFDASDQSNDNTDFSITKRIVV